MLAASFAAVDMTSVTVNSYEGYRVVRGASRQVPRVVLRGEWKAER